MSSLRNESILETIYEEVIEEATDTGNLAMMSDDDIKFEVLRRFESLQWTILIGYLMYYKSSALDIT